MSFLTHKRNSRQRKNWEYFLLDTFEAAFAMRNSTQRQEQSGHFFLNQGTQKIMLRMLSALICSQVLISGIISTSIIAIFQNLKHVTQEQPVVGVSKINFSQNLRNIVFCLSKYAQKSLKYTSEKIYPSACTFSAN